MNFNVNRVSSRSVIALFVLLCCTAPVSATVSLTLSDNSGAPNSQVVGAGQSFSFTVNLVSTAETTEGVDYYLTSPNGSGYFRITDRNTAGGMYNDPLYFTDTVVESSPSNILDPRNDNDLGGLATTPQGTGTKLVANYTLLVDAATPNGVYTINTTSNPGEGWVGGPAGDNPFNSHGTFTVSVPEPAGLGLAMLAAAKLIRRRRRLIP